MNGFFKWTFNVRRSGNDRPETAAELPPDAEGEASSLPGNAGPRRTEQKKNDGETFLIRRAATEVSPAAAAPRGSAGGGEEEPPETPHTLAGIGTIADCAKKQVRFLRRMNDLLKSRGDGAFYL